MLSQGLARQVAREFVLPWVVVPLVASFFGLAIIYDRRPVIDVATLAGKPVVAYVPELEDLIIEWRAFRYRTCPTTITTEIVDSTKSVHRQDAQSGPFSGTLGHDAWRAHRMVPRKAAWGPAKYRATVQYHCGWTHETFPLVIHTPEIEFVIGPPKK